MSYIEENLLPGEEVVYVARMHWSIYGTAIFCGIVAIALFQYPMIAAGFAFLAILTGVRAMIYVASTEYGVTTQRIIVKTGWISRRTIEQRLGRIESISFTQSISGRMMGYGTVLLHGTGSGVTPIAGIDDPLTFHKYAMAAMQHNAQNGGGEG